MNKEELLASIDFEIQKIKDEEPSASYNWGILTALGALLWFLTNSLLSKEGASVYLSSMSFEAFGKCVLYSWLCIVLLNVVNLQLKNSEKLGEGIYFFNDIFREIRAIFFLHFLGALVLCFLSFKVLKTSEWQSVLGFSCFVIMSFGMLSAFVLSYLEIPISFGTKFQLKSASNVSNRPRKVINILLKAFYGILAFSILIEIPIILSSIYYYLNDVYNSVQDNRTFFTYSALTISIIYLFETFLINRISHPYKKDFLNLKRSILFQKISEHEAKASLHQLVYGKSPREILENRIKSLQSFYNEKMVLVREPQFFSKKDLRKVRNLGDKMFEKVDALKILLDGFSSTVDPSLSQIFADLKKKKDDFEQHFKK